MQTQARRAFVVAASFAVMALCIFTGAFPAAAAGTITLAPGIYREQPTTRRSGTAPAEADAFKDRVQNRVSDGRLTYVGSADTSRQVAALG